MLVVAGGEGDVGAAVMAGWMAGGVKPAGDGGATGIDGNAGGGGGVGVGRAGRSTGDVGTSGEETTAAGAGCWKSCSA